MPESILLIDGMYLVFSSFYSHHAMRTIKGEPTGAVFGFVSRVESLVQELRPDRLVVAFDSKEKNFRRDLYPEYKAKRQLPPEELIQQLPAIREYLTCRGIHFLEKPGLEADDIIALLSRRFAAAGSEVLIFSADKDLFQLVGERVFIFHPKLKRKLDRAAVKEFFGVYPEQIADYLALAGDASDNIPGIPGIGDKTATKLIEKFGSLAAIRKDLDQVEGKFQEKIRANSHLFELWHQLLDFSRIPAVDLDLRVPLFVPRADACLADLYRRLQFSSLLKKIDVPAPAEAAGAALSFTLVENRDQLRALAKEMRTAGSFAWDVETTAIEFFKAGLVGISFFVAGRGYYVPFLFPAAAAGRCLLTLAEFKSEMAEIFCDARIKKTGHNLKFDMLHLRREGMPVAGVEHDTMIMSYLLFPNRRAHQLKELSAECLQVRQATYEDLVGKGKNRVEIAAVDVEQVGSYCVADSRCSWQLVEKLLPLLRDKKLLGLYREIEMPLVEVLLEMEWHGIGIDRAFLKKAAVRLQEQIAGMRKRGPGTGRL